MRLAGAIIQNERGQILLLHRNTGARKQWEIPGGKANHPETNVSAAIREIREELGVEIELAQRLGSSKFEENGKTFSYAWFRAQVKTGTVTIAEPRLHDDLRYFDLDELMGREDISASTKKLLEAILANKVGLGQLLIPFWEDV